MQMAWEYCRTNCKYCGPNPVVIQGCSPKGGPNCKTNGPNGGPDSNYQWACYNPDAVNANHTAWNGHSDFNHMCRVDEEITRIFATCKPHTGGCAFGGCPPPYPPSPGPSPPPPPPPPYGL